MWVARIKWAFRPWIFSQEAPQKARTPPPALYISTALAHPQPLHPSTSQKCSEAGMPTAAALVASLFTQWSTHLVTGDKKVTVSIHGPTGGAISHLPYTQGYSRASELPTGIEDPRWWPRLWRGSHVSNEGRKWIL